MTLSARLAVQRAPHRQPAGVCRRADQARPCRRAHRRRLQRLGRIEQPRRLPRGVSRSADQRRHRRAEHGRRWRRPRRLRLIPFVCGAAPFLTGRALEQIKADVAYSQHPVILCGMSPGMAYGELGPTHHSIEDLSWLRALPGLDIVVPADPAQTRLAVRGVVAAPRPTFIRVGRFKVPDVSTIDDPFERGRFTIARDGSDVTVIATGTMVSRALAAAERSRRRRCRRPRAQRRLAGAVRCRRRGRRGDARRRGIVTAEEARVTGGLGAAVAGIVGRPGSATAQAGPHARHPRRVRPDRQHGLPARILRPHGRRHRRRRSGGAEPWLTSGLAPPFVVAVDQGTSSTKAVLVDRRRPVLRRAAVPVAATYPATGLGRAGRRRDPRRSVHRAIDEVLAGVAVPPAASASARNASRRWCGNGARQGAWAGARAGRTAAPQAAAQRLVDGGSADARQLHHRTSRRPDVLGAEVGSGCSTTSTLTGGAAAAGELAVGTVDSWLTASLTGRHQIEAGNASRTQLLDLDRLEWAAELCDLFGVPAAVLPEIVGSAAITPLDPDAASALRCPLAAVLADSHAALYAHGTGDLGAGGADSRVKVTYGTGSSIMGVAGRRRRGGHRAPGSPVRSPGSSPNRPTRWRATSCPPGQRSSGWPSARKGSR